MYRAWKPCPAAADFMADIKALSSAVTGAPATEAAAAALGARHRLAASATAGERRMCFMLLIIGSLLRRDSDKIMERLYSERRERVCHDMLGR